MNKLLVVAGLFILVFAGFQIAYNKPVKSDYMDLSNIEIHNNSEGWSVGVWSIGGALIPYDNEIFHKLNNLISQYNDDYWRYYVYTSEEKYYIDTIETELIFLDEIALWNDVTDLILFEDNYCLNKSYWYNNGNGRNYNDGNWNEIENTLDCMTNVISEDHE